MLFRRRHEAILAIVGEASDMGTTGGLYLRPVADMTRTSISSPAREQHQWRVEPLLMLLIQLECDRTSPLGFGPPTLDGF